MAKKQTTAPDQQPHQSQQGSASKKDSMCPHVFVGGADGVQCSTCGMKLTTEEFRELLKADS